jgi:hypothetical protein
MALSLAPTLVVLLAIASLAFGAKAAEGRLVLEIQGLVGSEGAKVIQAMIEGAHRPRSGIAAILLGLIPLFVGATAAVSELKSALNTIWRVPDDPTCSTVRRMFNVVKEGFLSLQPSQRFSAKPPRTITARYMQKSACLASTRRAALPSCRATPRFARTAIGCTLRHTTVANT